MDDLLRQLQACENAAAAVDFTAVEHGSHAAMTESANTPRRSTRQQQPTVAEAANSSSSSSGSNEAVSKALEMYRDAEKAIREQAWKDGAAEDPVSASAYYSTESAMALQNNIKWRHRGPRDQDAPSTWRGQYWREGSKRYANRGGQSREYFAQKYGKGGKSRDCSKRPAEVPVERLQEQLQSALSHHLGAALSHRPADEQWSEAEWAQWEQESWWQQQSDQEWPRQAHGSDQEWPGQAHSRQEHQPWSAE